MGARMAWLMSLHIILLIIWSAGLFYVPILCGVDYRGVDQIRTRQARIMTRFVFVAVASPAAVLTIVTGGVLVYATNASGDWFAAKLTVVALMAMFHGYCGHMLALLGHEGHRKKKRLHSISGWLVTVPVVLVSLVLWLVLAKPVLLS